MSKFAALKLSGVEVPSKMTVLHPIKNTPMLANMPGTAGGEGGTATCFISMLSFESKLSRQIDREVMDRRVNARKRPTAAEIEEENLEKLVKLVVGGKEWLVADLEGEVIAQGEPSESDVRALLREADWLVEQLTEHGSQRANFVKG